MRVIITGVAGFIGSHVAEAMLADGADVIGIDDLSGGVVENVPPAVQFHQRDCATPLDDIFQSARPDAVMHLAAYAAEGLSHHIPKFNYINNVVGTANVLAAAYRSGAKHFVFTSSIAAYGHPTSSEPLTESTACVPCDPYGIAKLACEQHIRVFHSYYGAPNYTIFRPHNVFGPRQNISDPYRNVVGIFFRCAKQKLPFPVFGDGTQTRSFSYIDTVAGCIAKSPVVAEARNQTFNVGGDQPMSVGELAKAIASISGAPAELQLLPPRNEVMHAHASHVFAQSVFPDVFADAVSLADGLQRMADYVEPLEIPPPTPCPVEIEITDCLPPSWREAD